jgi:hypothetical protein
VLKNIVIVYLSITPYQIDIDMKISPSAIYHSGEEEIIRPNA